jgi:hypothetical protein
MSIFPPPEEIRQKHNKGAIVPQEKKYTYSQISISNGGTVLINTMVFLELQVVVIGYFMSFAF